MHALIRRTLCCFTGVVACLVLVAVRPARAQGTWRSPEQLPRYTVELEPHLAIGPFSPPGDGSGTGIGPGFRASIPILPRGFISDVNDSVAVGVGLDWLYYDAATRNRGVCTRFRPSPDGTPVCVEVDGIIGDTSYFFIPVVMQWNFFLQQRVSVFAEPGINVYLRRDTYGNYRPGPSLNIQVGGRFLFNDNIAATLRLGYPTCTLGISFLL
jgi:hypothetical protein